MSVLVVCAVALIASGLTFFSGFGLGTLLLPAFALFYPVQTAVALTAVVHFLNGVFKLALVGRHVDLRILGRFGLPAFAASFAGASALLWLADIQPLASYSLWGRDVLVTPAKLAVGLLLLVFSAAELHPRFRGLSFASRYFVLGGALSGFFGGLSGMQGALRAAFLARAGLTKEAFIGTGSAIACLIDVSRLGVYSRMLLGEWNQMDRWVLAAAVLCAFAGAALGNRYLKSITMKAIQRTVAILLFAVALGLMSGVL